MSVVFIIMRQKKFARRTDNYNGNQVRGFGADEPQRFPVAWLGVQSPWRDGACGRELEGGRNGPRWWHRRWFGRVIRWLHLRMMQSLCCLSQRKLAEERSDTCVIVNGCDKNNTNTLLCITSTLLSPPALPHSFVVTIYSKDDCRLWRSWYRGSEDVWCSMMWMV